PPRFCSWQCRVLCIEVGCFWKGCASKVKVHKIKQGYYKNRRQGLARYVLCQEHESLVVQHLSNYRLSGLFKLFKRKDVWCYRNISSAAFRLYLWDRAGRKCEGCTIDLAFSKKATHWEIDHKIPIFRGGLSDWENLQVLCIECHRKKTGKEKSESVAMRWSGAPRQRVTRQMIGGQKDALIAELRRENEMLRAKIAVLES